jgi:hypothetical protein
VGELRDTDTLRIALSMVRADWQGDEPGWEQLWALSDDPHSLARTLTVLCREGMEHLASVAGISMGEMLHRQAGKLIPHPDAAPAGHIDLRTERIAHQG